MIDEEDSFCPLCAVQRPCICDQSDAPRREQLRQHHERWLQELRGEQATLFDPVEPA
jgi:hypothetical protein